MKGLSVKKIAALAAGAAILGASVAVADTLYGNTPIVNQNGQPVVKIVVGQNAAASDGVVAANIAAVIGNKAYSKQTISATVSGTATCTTISGAGTGAGSCPISNEKVILEVTLPGIVSGSASFKTYINDYVDKYTEDRKTAPFGSANNYSTTTEIKPFFTGTATTGNVGSSSNEVADPSTGAKHGRKITGGDFPALASTTVRDTYAGKSYTEEQSVWVYGDTVYDETSKAVVANTPNVAYKVDFTQDQYGLPTYSSSSWSTTSPATEQTARHRVSIKFLGEDWIISELNEPAGMISFDPSASVAKTGSSSISLAKESAYGIVHIGENLTAGAYAVKLADIGLATGTGNVHSAAIEIYDANGVLVKEDQVNPDTTYSWTAPDGSKLKLHVYQTQPGYTLASKWAEMAVYSNEMTLTHAAKIDNVDNPLWYPYLYWANNPNNNNVTTLKSILLMRSSTDPSTVLLKLNKGDSVPIITTPSKFQMSFDGINLGSADYDALTFTVTGATSLTYGVSGCVGSASTAQTRFLQVTTGISNAFTVSGSPVSNFYLDLNNVNETSYTGMYYQQSGQTCFFRTNVTNGSSLATYNLGDGVTQSIYLLGATPGTTGNVSLYLEEKASATEDIKDKLLLELDNSTDTAWAFSGTSSSSNNRIKYYGASSAASADASIGPSGYITTWKPVDVGFTSERGTIFNSLSSKAAVLKVAKKIAEATYYVSIIGSAPGGATEITLAEGEEQTLAGGVKIKAKSITETVGSCTAQGGAGSCKVDMAPVSAVLTTGDASVNAITSYKVLGDLVVLDNQAGAADTVIAVGGPAVNEVTKAALGTSSTLSAPGNIVVKEIGKVIVVAGYTAQDTMDAGNQFINGLQTT
ncbi:MAG: S-layer protein [Candidatus Micrarchaeota archaeon]